MVGFDDWDAMALIGQSRVLSTALPRNKNFPHRRSCNELQSNLIMINHYVAFYHKIPNTNFMSIVKMKSMYVYGS